MKPGGALGHSAECAKGAASGMSAVVYDAGVVVAADGNERRAWAEYKARSELGVVPLVPPGGCSGQPVSTTGAASALPGRVRGRSAGRERGAPSRAAVRQEHDSGCRGCGCGDHSSSPSGREVAVAAI